MIGLEHVMAAQFMLADYKVKCEMPQAPEITVSASGLDIKVVTDKTVRQLTEMTPITDTPFEKGAVVHREGLRLGRIGVTGGYQFGTTTYPELKQVCMYVSKVTVNIHLDPTIFIANEFKPGTCHYNEVLNHEMKHIKLDRKITNKYTGVIVKAINNTLKKVGYVHGPYRVDQLPALQKQIAGIIDNVITQFSNNMNKENNYLQKTTVDTLQEYQRVDAMCQDKPQVRF